MSVVIASTPDPPYQPAGSRVWAEERSWNSPTEVPSPWIVIARLADADEGAQEEAEEELVDVVYAIAARARRQGGQVFHVEQEGRSAQMFLSRCRRRIW
jgi:hypothetical protein